MTDWETNEIGTEQALREALELLGIEAKGNPADIWRAYQKTDEYSFRSFLMKRRKELEQSDWWGRHESD